MAEEKTPDIAEKDLSRSLAEMNKALPGYQKAERYYTGEESEKYLSNLLRQALSGSENDFYINLSSRVVHAVTDRLEISALSVVAEDGTPQSVSPYSESADYNPSNADENMTVVEKLNQILWHNNELDQEAPDVHLKAGYLGDSYVFMWPNDEGGMDLFMHRPEGVRVFYEIENPRKKKMAVHSWKDEDDHFRVNLWYPDYCVKFRSNVANPRKNDASAYSRFADDDTDENGIMENILGVVPFWHFRTDRPYGTPIHKNSYGPQDGITKLIRSSMTITDFASFPQRWALGETGVGSDEDFDWEDDETLPEDLQSDLISGPGRIMFLKNIKNIGQFAAANVDQTLKPLDKMIELMAAATGTPMTYLNKVRGTASTPLSGASQREMEASHLHKVRAIQRSFGSTWRSLFTFALEWLGDENAVVSIKWAPAYFRDDKETWDSVLSQQTAGVPKRVTLMEQGYTESEVESWGYTEDEPDGPSGGMDPFVAEQRKPVRPELRDNMDGDTSRFEQPENGDDNGGE